MYWRNWRYIGGILEPYCGYVGIIEDVVTLPAGSCVCRFRRASCWRHRSEPGSGQAPRPR